MIKQHGAPAHRLAILLSGRGSNFIAIADAIDRGALPHSGIALVLSNVPDAPGLAAAKARGLNAIAEPSQGLNRGDHDRVMLQHLREYRIDWVVLAGYMRVLTPAFIAAYPRRIVNVHPSLLPAFPGLHPQRQALTAGVAISGCTVHFVNEIVDNGEIILQRTVPVLPTDDEDTLSARILAEEHIAYPEALRQLLKGGELR